MKLILIPGYKENTNRGGYRSIINFATARKWEIQIIKPNYSKKLLSQIINESTETIGSGRHSIIIGFSIGALIAFCISKRVPVEKAFFCSISPILGKDAREDKRDLSNYFGNDFYDEISKMRYGKSIAKNILFLYGDKEGKKLIGRTKKLHKGNGHTLVAIKNNDHDFDTTYAQVVIDHLQ
jgi:esterase/lipase